MWVGLAVTMLIALWWLMAPTATPMEEFPRAVRSAPPARRVVVPPVVEATAPEPNPGRDERPRDHVEPEENPPDGSSRPAVVYELVEQSKKCHKLALELNPGTTYTRVVLDLQADRWGRAESVEAQTEPPQPAAVHDCLAEISIGLAPGTLPPEGHTMRLTWQLGLVVAGVDPSDHQAEARPADLVGRTFAERPDSLRDTGLDRSP